MKFTKFDRWCMGWVYIAEGLVKVFSFGCYNPSWTVNVARRVSRTKN